MKKFISLFTVVSLVIVSICSTYVSVDATSTVDYVSKIDSGLIQVMDNATDTENIPVIVWFNEIDLEKVNQKIENELSKQIVNNKVSEETQELFELKTNDPSISKNRVKIQDIEDNLTIADSQQLIKTERKFFKREYLNKNKSVCDKIEDKIGEIDITYISHYAPCIEVNLTKGQILSIINISEVNNISYYNHDVIELDFASEIDVVDTGKSQLANLTACGIQENIDKYNLTGSGINVGIIDSGFTYDTLNTYFSRVNISTDINCNPMTEEECKNSPDEGGNSHTHGDYVASIIGANGKNFKGAVKDCNMYLTNAADTYSGYIEKIEWLIDKGSNVINSSFIIYSEDEALNSYNSLAKWLDTIAVRTTVTFVQASGNYGKNDVKGMCMCYNPIVVGSCDNNGVVWNDTSYTDITGRAYKPDLVAQGEDAVSPYGSAGCTSSAAPLVTAAAVQLCQYSPIIMNSPVLLKAYLLNGATYLGVENQLGSYDVFNAFDRSSGAGALNAANSLKAYFTRNEMGGTINDSKKTITGIVSVSSAKKQVHITLCSLKNNTIYGKDPSEVYNVSEKPLIGFEINVTYTGSDGYTYHSRTTIDNKVSVIFTPPKKGYYKIEANAITDVGNNSTTAALIYTSI